MKRAVTITRHHGVTAAVNEPHKTTPIRDGDKVRRDATQHISVVLERTPRGKKTTNGRRTGEQENRRTEGKWCACRGAIEKPR